MPDQLTSLVLFFLTLASLGASVAAVRRFAGKGVDRQAGLLVETMLVWLCGAGAGLLFVYRWMWVNGRWAPLEAHVDGLLLIAALLAPIILLLRDRARLPGLTAFGLPVLTVILGWALCASAWTFHPFHIGSVWKTIHLTCVYLGTLMYCVAAVAGGMYLYAEQRLHGKGEGMSRPTAGSLETIEKLVIRTSGLGFGLMTLVLATGLVIHTADPEKLGADWWYSPKILLATAVWLVYALVMNVRHAMRFRGSRAAWLSIAGLVLLMTTWWVVTKVPGPVEKVGSTALIGWGRQVSVSRELIIGDDPGATRCG